MKSELAGLLKCAGYPFNELLVGDDMGKDWVQIDNKQYVAPSLSELIEACGPGRFVLDRLESGFWEAGHQNAHPMIHKGNTPEEAVARVWMAINKNAV